MLLALTFFGQQCQSKGPVQRQGSINLFINSDAILNRDALWSIQGKNHHVNAAIVRGIRCPGKILR